MTYSVTVRDEISGETVSISGIIAVDASEAAYAVQDAPASDWRPGSAVVDFYQLDPELDTFSFGYFSRLEDAMTAGLFTIRQHDEFMERPVGSYRYVKLDEIPQVVNGVLLTPPDVWHLVDDDRPEDSDSYITMCQIVKYDLWTSPDPVTSPSPQQLPDALGRRVDDFLENPESGVRRTRPERPQS
jgi:hypothetical protein